MLNISAYSGKDRAHNAGSNVPRPSSRVSAAAVSIGEQLLAWRKLHGLTAVQVAERAGISRNTLRRIETGDPGVSFEAFLGVARALGVLDALVAATDPYETDLGRARADEVLPKRVRR
ncbi:helix-turn-helix domain-containing protein [Pseudosporangium ferrugineum]|nr:helix-turn-helix transcriptional regulator [Pseudosporangium ferrugineum]